MVNIDGTLAHGRRDGVQSESGQIPIPAVEKSRDGLHVSGLVFLDQAGFDSIEKFQLHDGIALEWANDGCGIGMWKIVGDPISLQIAFDQNGRFVWPGNPPAISIEGKLKDITGIVKGGWPFGTETQLIKRLAERVGKRDRIAVTWSDCGRFGRKGRRLFVPGAEEI